MTFDGVNIEIQIRTMLQHAWANWLEWFADVFGRQIRYGEPPTPPDPTGEAILAVMMELSEEWAARETRPVSVAELEAVTDEAVSRLKQAIDA